MSVKLIAKQLWPIQVSDKDSVSMHQGKQRTAEVSPATSRPGHLMFGTPKEPLGLQRLLSNLFRSRGMQRRLFAAAGLFKVESRWPLEGLFAKQGTSSTALTST